MALPPASAAGWAAGRTRPVALQSTVCGIRSRIDLIGQRHQHAPAVVSRLVRVVVVSGAIRSRCASMEATNDSHSSVSDMQMNGTQSNCLSAINFDFSDDFKEISLVTLETPIDGVDYSYAIFMILRPNYSSNRKLLKSKFEFQLI
jgi:hypothetical protein